MRTSIFVLLVVFFQSKQIVAIVLKHHEKEMIKGRLYTMMKHQFWLALGNSNEENRMHRLDFFLHKHSPPVYAWNDFKNHKFSSKIGRLAGTIPPLESYLHSYEVDNLFKAASWIG